MAKKKKSLDYNKLTWSMLSWVIRIVLVILVVTLFFVGITKGYSLGYEVFNPTAVTDAENRTVIELVIEEGDSAWSIGRRLSSESIISDTLVFWAQAQLYQIHFWPGTYEVSSDMTSMDILNVFQDAYEEATQ